MSLYVEIPIKKSITAIGKRYISLNHCNKKGIKLNNITDVKINPLNLNAFSLPYLIAI